MSAINQSTIHSTFPSPSQHNPSSKITYLRQPKPRLHPRSQNPTYKHPPQLLLSPYSFLPIINNLIPSPRNLLAQLLEMCLRPRPARPHPRENNAKRLRFAADVDDVLRGVVEEHVDEEGGGGEFAGVEVCDFLGEGALLEGGKGDGMVDVVEWHVELIGGVD
jgi:hypothetical protein